MRNFITFYCVRSLQNLVCRLHLKQVLQEPTHFSCIIAMYKLWLPFWTGEVLEARGKRKTTKVGWGQIMGKQF